VRGFVFGILLLALLTATILSLRPGGIRRQLRFAARRLRIVLVLGAVYVVASTIIRIFFASGPVSDYGPPAIALVLFAVFLFAARDPLPADR
jgi:hypothetical protein